MVTMVGNESDFAKLIKELIYLEHDAIAAYESTIERLDDKALSAKVAEFHQEHLQHLSTLNKIAAEAGADAPTKGDMKQMVTKGKIALADIFGDKSILKAMNSNEEDTVKAYERASRHTEARPETKAFFIKAHQDEVRHRAWFETTSEQL